MRHLEYQPGGKPDPAALVGCRDIAVGYDYASGQPDSAHFGPNKDETADGEVIPPHGKGTPGRKRTKANELPG